MTQTTKMINLTSEQLTRVQETELELLKEVDRICKKCNIKYSIIAGTLLGAVRHKGFIPWDDDADLVFFREEYTKFRKACETELDTTKFYFQDHTNTKGYRWGYGKLRKKDTLFLRQNQEHMEYEQGIFIDLFPIDYVPNNYILRSIHNFHCFCVRKILWSPVGMVASETKFKKAWFKFIFNTIGDSIFKHYDKLVVNSNKTKTNWIRTLTFPMPNKNYGYPAKWYEGNTILEFEGEYFSAISHYEDYLTFKFGNYMALPPPEQRKIHPVTQIKV